MNLSAYRIVQEALSNAMRHSPGAAVQVKLYYGDAALVVEVRNDHCPPETPQPTGVFSDGGGHGIIGMRERATMLGGSLQAGPIEKGEFLVTAASPAGRWLGTGRVVTIRVVIADDQGMVRSGFSVLLNAQSDIEVIAEAVNGQEAITQAAELHPDVILMDVRMPVLDGLQATRAITAMPTTRRRSWY